MVEVLNAILVYSIQLIKFNKLFSWQDVKSVYN